MINYFKYLPVSAEDEKWGLCVLNTGCTKIQEQCDYPVNHHPNRYHFDWQTGRILQEYQLIYITRGEGIFESEAAGLHNIKEGSVILLFPNERHRYKPNDKTGWDEYWVGFKGEIIDTLVERNFFKPESPIVHLGFNENLLHTFLEIIEKCTEEKPGYQSAISGAAHYLLGQTFSAKQQERFCSDDYIAQIINKARVIFRANVDSRISPEDVARDLNMSYSSFRKAFKSYAGIAPGQFLLQLRIQKAGELLTGSNIPIKQIAFNLNFDSSFYFSKIFKEKTGITPNEYRKSRK